ncbi:hypothetical protein PGT21_004989 [Puccinia graminis f. sp. tritici]|uniref:Uncharacterized protein n=1 Tax=Puccinia graminis f. sp. tritici TaxID=56615 RepID=A0A5B0QU17_PUCGR|nr:hypothetical protein PGT21_004989 [Puccinia graminis f. sp. tritici]
MLDPVGRNTKCQTAAIRLIRNQRNLEKAWRSHDDTIKDTVQTFTPHLFGTGCSPAFMILIKVSISI